ncbi:MAG TPA: 1,4-alpha-glucan branching protein GlgB [Candidatus Eisenbergiella merdipullorum]|uniref:1,4-alpha-glucan branching enzyme n=1 Tax=Candidatus Eisenbergiella merdipullorum TaxID=2838553 RepID=A0A9D2I3K1_9FIRM|nr:1,4-alpha-glucan branching protein GlgB [Candidatus Eisenbergiella merdipullorum]
MDMYGFYTGKIFDAYEYLGCRPGRAGAVFRTFAPAADRISVIGSFNGWMETPMNKIYDGNFWECVIPEARTGDMYKYRIWRKDGTFRDHCDPYGLGMELRPQTASFIRDMTAYRFRDAGWMKRRSDCRKEPLNIYEIHAGSWKKKGKEETDWYRYDELADLLIPYLKECGYNYVELMPLGEHPSDASWGYQQTGFFSPTSRYGTADELKRMVDLFHQNGIGLILDFVPVHFAVDDYALADYDGTALYEYPSPDVGNSEWGSRNFMHSRGEVRSFLQSCADYWLKEYHFDGLRMDAISNMIYWQGQPERGVNRNAVEFLQYMNRGLKERHPGILLAAEDSTSFPGVTKGADAGGLGFDYKWDMGWMNDTLDYFRTDPEYRTGEYHKLTFSMMYFYEENYLLPLSHDEVVHGKATIIQKMNGEYEKKFPQARALYMYMYAHPGKKLNFMGNELAHFREWDEKRELDWELLEFPLHAGFHAFIKELNRLYLDTPALWLLDYDRKGFRWVDCHEEKTCTYAFLRTDGKQELLAVFHFSGKEEKDFRLILDGQEGCFELCLSSDWDIYGGTQPAAGEKGKLLSSRDGALFLDLPAFGGLYLMKRDR